MQGKKKIFNFRDITPSGFHYFSRHGTFAWKSRKNDVRLIEHRFCISPILLGTIAKIILHFQGSMSQKNILFQCHPDAGRISEPYKVGYCGTGHPSKMDDDKHVLGHLRTDSSLIVQNWKCPREGFRAQRRIYFFWEILSS